MQIYCYSNKYPSMADAYKAIRKRQQEIDHLRRQAKKAAADMEMQRLLKSTGLRKECSK